MTKKLFIVPENGFVNRLISVISGLRIAHYSDREPILVAKDDISFNGRLKNLLDLQLTEVDSLHLEPNELGSSASLEPIGGRSFYVDSDIQICHISGWHHFVFTEDDYALLQRIGEQGRLKIESELRGYSYKLLEKLYDDSRYDLGIHIRTNTGERDNNFQWTIPQISNLSNCISEKVQIWKIKKIYIACTSLDVRDALVQNLSERHPSLDIESGYSAKTNLTDKEKLLQDFRGLLNSNKIIRHPMSTFSALPSFINGYLEAIYLDNGELFERHPSLFKGCAL